MGARSDRPGDAMPAAAEVSLGAVRLNVADLDRAQDFYERVIGLRPIDRSAAAVRLGAANGEAALVELVGCRDAPKRPSRTTGLFHLAILVPNRVAFAGAVRRVAAGWRLTGASDHLVSEAAYLSDPEGNGIEIYRDRPREDWRYVDGQVQMDTLPLDLESVLGELRVADPGSNGMPAGTRIGHVHLNVADLAGAEDFYAGLLGFDVTTRGYPGALFLSIGGYHHHIGVNTWSGEGAPAPPPGSLGLRWFEIALPGAPELEALRRRLGTAGIGGEDEGDGLRVADPSGNSLLLRIRPTR